MFHLLYFFPFEFNVVLVGWGGGGIKETIRQNLTNLSPHIHELSLHENSPVRYSVVY
jgi:hypothetical protein